MMVHGSSLTRVKVFNKIRSAYDERMTDFGVWSQTTASSLEAELTMVGRYARVISSDEASLGDQEDASKQERKIDDINKDA
ncbi:hypothetical protein Tco_1072339 [Tanacetum coccineum]